MAGYKAGSLKRMTARTVQGAQRRAGTHPSQGPAKPRKSRAKPKCESGWTGDRCTRVLGHPGPHSNERSRKKGKR